MVTLKTARYNITVAKAEAVPAKQMDLASV
jgi:hypothetical protein